MARCISIFLVLFTLHPRSTTSQGEVCGGDFDLEATPVGEFASPGYNKSSYPQNTFCRWRFTAGIGERIAFAFTDFDLTTSENCEGDHLSMKERGWQDETKYCGNDAPEEILSRTNDVVFTFHSNMVGTCRGFQIAFRAVEESLSCGAKTNAMQFNFISPNYSASLPTNESLDCILTVDHGCLQNICQLRLDFEDFRIQPPIWGDCRLDSFSIESDQQLPILCGNNNDTHMYIDVQGRGKTSLIFMLEKIEQHLYNCYDIYNKLNSQEEASISELFAQNLSVEISTKPYRPVALYKLIEGDIVRFPQDRAWKIKVTQIPCNCPKTRVPKAPDGCLQYHQGISGAIESFNFDNMGCYTEDRLCDFSKIKDHSDCDIFVGNTGHLNNLDYSICIEQKGGFGGIEFEQENMDDFSLSTEWNSEYLPSYTPLVGDECRADYIMIAGLVQPQSIDDMNVSFDRLCGGSFGSAPVCSTSKPFLVRVKTDKDEFSDAPGYMERGFRLKFTQVA